MTRMKLAQSDCWAWRGSDCWCASSAGVETDLACRQLLTERSTTDGIAAAPFIWISWSQEDIVGSNTGTGSAEWRVLILV